MENLSKDISFRWLGMDEFQKVSEIFIANDWALPDPRVAAIRVGEDATGRIVALGCVQLLPFIGPAWVDETQRNQGLANSEIAALYEAAKASGPFHGACISTSNPIVKRIASALGMRDTGETFYVKEF